MAAQRKRRRMVWDEPKTRAFNLVFEGRKTRDNIALDCAVSARTLDDWIAHPDFQAALAEKRAKLMESLDHKPYIRKERRLIALADMAESARQQYEAHPLLIERRPTGRDEDTGELLMLEQEAFNKDAFAAFRDALNDIAKELGERVTNNTNVNAAQIVVVAVAQDVLEAV